MAGNFRSHVRSNVIGYLALFVALSGTAWAATELDKNEVKSKHIKNRGVKTKDLANNAVTSPKVADGSLLGEDFAAGQLPQGPQGDVGPRGPQGEPGRSALEPLRSGEAVYGTWAMKNETASAVSRAEAVSLPIPAPVPITTARAHVDGFDESGECAGSAANPTATPGDACVYVSYSSGVTNAAGDAVTNLPNGSLHGFEISMSGGNFWEARGTWAYTSP